MIIDEKRLERQGFPLRLLYLVHEGPDAIAASNARAAEAGG
jgi:hypothetical protein